MDFPFLCLSLQCFSQLIYEIQTKSISGSTSLSETVRAPDEYMLTCVDRVVREHKTSQIHE